MKVSEEGEGTVISTAGKRPGLMDVSALTEGLFERLCPEESSAPIRRDSEGVPLSNREWNVALLSCCCNCVDRDRFAFWLVRLSVSYPKAKLCQRTAASASHGKVHARLVCTPVKYDAGSKRHDGPFVAGENGEATATH